MFRVTIENDDFEFSFKVKDLKDIEKEKIDDMGSRLSTLGSMIPMISHLIPTSKEELVEKTFSRPSFASRMREEKKEEMKQKEEMKKKEDDFVMEYVSCGQCDDKKFASQKEFLDHMTENHLFEHDSSTEDKKSDENSNNEDGSKKIHCKSIKITPKKDREKLKKIKEEEESLKSLYRMRNDILGEDKDRVLTKEEHDVLSMIQRRIDGLKKKQNRRQHPIGSKNDNVGKTIKCTSTKTTPKKEDEDDIPEL